MLPLRGGRTLCAGRRGFTLIEVLVVVAIIALLISILLPSLALARAQSKRVYCGANTRQIGLVLQLYTIEYKHFPGHHLTDGNPQLGLQPNQVMWPVRLLRFMEKQYQAFWCPSAPENTRWNGRDTILPSVTVADQPHETAFFGYGYNDWESKSSQGRIWAWAATSTIPTSASCGSKESRRRLK